MVGKSGLGDEQVLHQVGPRLAELAVPRVRFPRVENLFYFKRVQLA
jgi:hypothetical protein